MDGLTRREVLLTGGALLGAETIVNGAESRPPRQVTTASIPETVELIGVLGKPLCTLITFSGEWMVDYDHSIKSDSLQLKIRTVDNVELPQAAKFPIRLIELLRQTTGMDTEEVLQRVREGDAWVGLGFETAELNWIPAAVFRLPGVVPFRDGRPTEVVSRLTCARLGTA